MRMRKKPNLHPRMERCSAVWIREPEKLRGNWRSLKEDARELRIEIGCGKGKFTVETAKNEPDVLLIAVEKVPDAMVVAMEKAVAEGVTNVFFVAGDAAELCDMFGEGEADRIYLNFCDPWPRKRNAKRRLTYHTFLRRYARVLRDGAMLEFKTDNSALFAFSLEEFRDCGWFRLQNVTDDLHADGPVGVMTGYEEKFYELGTPIHRCEAVQTVRPPEEETEHENPDCG